MRKILAVLAVVAMALVGMAGAANYMYEKASVKGVGYSDSEQIISTQIGYNGIKLVHKESGSGNVLTNKMELEAERQIGSGCCYAGNFSGTGRPCMDYVNFTKSAEFEYMPVSYQTGNYDSKWIEKLCVQNYRIGGVLTEMYTHAESLQKSGEVRTRAYGNNLLHPAARASWRPTSRRALSGWLTSAGSQRILRPTQRNSRAATPSSEDQSRTSRESSRSRSSSSSMVTQPAARSALSGYPACR